MSLSVKHLNGDATFLLSFSAIEDPRFSNGYLKRAGDFTILLDPWVTGPSKVFHPKFALTHRVIPSCIRHLSEIPAPNVVIISQDKPDHCHEETLRQLPPELKDTWILAQPAAAKKIRGWKYFNPEKIVALPVFSDRRPDSTIVRFNIASPLRDGSPGEVTIAYMPAKRDLTGLHTAIGITYRAPATNQYLTSPYSATFSRPFPTFFNHPMSTSHSMSSTLSLPVHASSSYDEIPDTPSTAMDDIISNASSLPYSPASSISSAPSIHAPVSAKTLSVLFSPHGVSYNSIHPYVTSHLIQQAALPLTCLLHSFDRIQNPWYLGGNISTGLPGGIEIADKLLARVWVGAHDEDKDNTGLSVKKIVTRKYSAQEVQALVDKERKGTKVGVEVKALESGEETWLTA